MHYFGPNLNLSSSLFADADEVIVEQQPAGCGSVNIFREVVQHGSKYSFLIVRAGDWLNFNPFNASVVLGVKANRHLIRKMMSVFLPLADLGESTVLSLKQ